jgi:hypothetical protein
MGESKLFDINKIPTDGYLVMPLSMSRLSSKKGQSPEECFEIIKFFEKKVSQVGVDFIFLYTNGLYYNNEESALSVRKKTNVQMIEHKNKILKLLVKSKKYIPQAAHFIPWDYVILNSPKYQEYYQKLVSLKDKDKLFKKYLEEGLKGRKPTEANLNFIIEEIVVTHLIRNGLIDFPKTLVKQDKFRLIIYPGAYLKADQYQLKKKILLQNNGTNPYSSSHYDFSKKVVCNLNKIELTEK